MLQVVAVCCSVFLCDAVCRCVAGCCSVLVCGAGCCRVLQGVALYMLWVGSRVMQIFLYSKVFAVLQGVAGCCRVLHGVAGCCSVYVVGGV